MFNFLALLTGAIVALMIMVNGELTIQHGVFISTAIIHIVGIIFALLLLKLKNIKMPSLKNLPFWVFTGGMFGIITTVCNNFSFGKISVTAILALGLFGQTVTSLFIDSFGLFGAKKSAIKKSTLIGIIVSLIGITVMMDFSALSSVLALVLSISAGFSVVMSRVTNSGLAKNIGALNGSLINHVVGLPFAILLVFLFDANKIFANLTGDFAPFWVYLGGVLGVIVVMLFNIVMINLTSFRVTILSFVGQTFAGLLIDVFMGNAITYKSLFGGILVAFGMLLNIILDQLSAKKTAKKV